MRILVFYRQGAVLGILNKGLGLRPSGFTWQVTSARLASDVIQVWMNSSSSNNCISHFKAQLVQLIFIYLIYWIKGILCGYAIRSGRHPSGSPAVGPADADFPRDVCLTVTRNHKVFLLYLCIPTCIRKISICFRLHYAPITTSDSYMRQ